MSVKNIANSKDTNYNNKISKIRLTYKKYSKLLSVKKEERNLILSSFFGKTFLKIPQNLILEVDKESKSIFFFSKEKKKNKSLKSLKSFYNLIIFSSYGVVFGHFMNMSIKGIGYKFELLGDQIIVYNGNSLPTYFTVPKDIIVLDNNMVNNYSLVGGSYILLTSFSNNIRNTSIPNKYKEIGIFLQKKL
jgi:ribosomal protein L6P/L9E